MFKPSSVEINAGLKNLFLNTLSTYKSILTFMNSRSLTASLLYHELDFTASRSSGPGGQNVNKVNSKITVKFDIVHSQILTEEEKGTILKRLSPQLTKAGVLIVSSQDSRSQLENKEIVVRKLEQMIASAIEKKKIRKPSKPSKGTIQKRITSKKHHAEKKKWRQKPE
jgi:ribosome-associated protein